MYFDSPRAFHFSERHACKHSPGRGTPLVLLNHFNLVFNHLFFHLIKKKFALMMFPFLDILVIDSLFKEWLHLHYFDWWDGSTPCAWSRFPHGAQACQFQSRRVKKLAPYFPSNTSSGFPCQRATPRDTCWESTPYPCQVVENALIILKKVHSYFL